jgi:hypothetical protein
MERKFKPLDDEFEHGDTVFSFSCSMFKMSEFITAVKQALQAVGLDQLRNKLNQRGGIPGTIDQWYIQGVDCEFLKPGNKVWKKGKIRIKISLELCPDEPEVEETPESNNPDITQPESPLDDIRKMIN